MSLSEWPKKFKDPDPNEVEYIEIHFDKEMVYDHRRSTLQAICVRERGKPKDLEWIPISVLPKTNNTPDLPPTYFRSLWVDLKFAQQRGWIK